MLSLQQLFCWLIALVSHYSAGPNYFSSHPQLGHSQSSVLHAEREGVARGRGYLFQVCPELSKMGWSRAGLMGSSSHTKPSLTGHSVHVVYHEHVQIRIER